MSPVDNCVDYSHFIHGRPVKGVSGRVIDRYSPGHGKLISRFAEGTAADASEAIQAARLAFDEGPWRHTTGAERQALLTRVAAAIRQHRDELGTIECLESGKPISQAKNEMDWAAGLWDYAAALCRHLHGDTTNTLGPGSLGLTLREPCGVAGLITPWNFPLLIASQKLPFALAAGCTAVIKPSEMTSGTTLRLAELLKQAGLPDGVCNVVTGYGDPVGRTIVESHDVDIVSFTGSTRVGRQVASAAGARLAKVSLELGGKNPQVVFPDAPLERAAKAVVHGAFFNMGECCNAGSRLLVHREIADRFVESLIDQTRQLHTGDPMDPDVTVGAMISQEHQAKVLRSVRESESAGAVVCIGGSEMPSEQGRFIMPTIIDHVTPDMDIAGVEVFGPVLVVLRFDNEAEAVRLANATEYGLSAGIWTDSADTAMRMARATRAGTIWINTFLEGSGELPFGGYRQSGLGRELGPDSVLEFCETKTIAMHVEPG